MESTIIFIYAKEGKIKAFCLEEIKSKGNDLIENGWSHTATLDPCVFIQYLHNECEGVDLISEMKDLSNS